MSDQPSLPATQPKPPTPAQQYRGMVEKLVARELEAMLEDNAPAVAKAKARIAIAFRDAAQGNPDLYACTPESVARAVLMTVVTGLAPGGVAPTCYLLSRFNKKTGKELQWMVSHRGLVQLAQRAGYGVRAVAVHNSDDFDLDLSAIAPPSHRPGAIRTWENLVGVYVVIYRLDTGARIGWEYIDRSQIEARRAQSDAYRRGAKEGAQDWERSSPWFKWPVEMALKTAIKWAAARGILPTDDALGHALSAEADDAIEVEAVPVPAAPKQLPQNDPLEILDAPREREPVEAEEEAPGK